MSTLHTLAVRGAKARLEEIAAEEAELARERKELGKLMRGRGEHPSKANGRWQMTPARVENVRKMLAGRKKAWEVWHIERDTARMKEATRVEEALATPVTTTDN